MAQAPNIPAKPAEGGFYHAVFEHSPFPTLVLDPEMTVLAVNRKFLERYGKESAQVVGQLCHRVFHDSSKPCPRDRCQFKQAISGQRDCVNLHEWTGPNGEQLVDEIHLTPLTHPDGKIWGVLESVREITQARNLQATLQEANEFLNRLLDSLVGVVVAADLEGNILFVNRSAKRVLGYEPGELVGKKLWEITDSEELKRVRHTLEENQGKALMVHTYVISRGGEHIPVRLNSSYVYRDREPVATVGIFTDLRERLRMEDQVNKARMQVIQSDKLAGLGRMAAGVAHELNNPLTGIMVFAELMRENLADDDPAFKDLSCILEDAERCQEIVKDMLEYSRQSEVRIEQVDLNQVVEDSFGLIRDNAVFLHVDIRREYYPEPLMVHADPKLMRQVFINLVMNAVDAMQGEGSLLIKTGLDKDGWRYAEVSDSGPGISEEVLQKVFDPFFTTKEVGRGTGLGLSVVIGVMERHGGEVSVKKTGPQGTTFLVRMPPEAPAELAMGGEYFNQPAPAGSKSEAAK